MQCDCAILSSVACPALQYFPHHLINGTIKKKELLDIKSVFMILSTSFVLSISILSRIKRDMIKASIGLHIKYPLRLSDFN